MLSKRFRDFQMSRMTVITLFLSFLSFSCDFLASMISTNIANIAIHWLCFLLTYDIENYSQYVLEFIFSVLALNACMSVVAGLKEKLQMMLKNFEKIVQVHMELLNGLKEGFIALTQHENKLQYANKSANLIMSQLTIEELNSKKHEISQKELEQKIFSKVDS